ncbi:MAG TPA: PD-(D/E)XK nuclease family protein [Actinoplanes sp.]|jgi:putative RecB family exonuclease|nr:PD-(D/E)XK nuclease family protein [Actinoplanes sp.]
MTVTPSIPAPVTFAGPSLSPSRAADFKTCPLLFRFRTIDKLPEKPSPDQVRGTLVHAVLESLFDLPAAERTPAAAAALVAPSWERLVTQEPAVAELFPTAGASSAPSDPALGAAAGSSATPSASLATDAPGAVPEAPRAVPDAPGAVPDAIGTASGAAAGSGLAASDLVADALPGTEALAVGEPARLADFLAGAGALLDGYFAVEDPRRLEPAERESLVNTLVDDALLIRGYIDRLDVSPAGDLRVVDYKTGGAPREAFEGRALFQLKFYALVLWRTRGVVPRVLRLLYLKDAEICDYSPEAEELERFERTLIALSQAIERAKRDRDFRPKPSRLCGWCSHQAFCPEFGGTPPPYPEPTAPAAPDATLDGPAPTLQARV